MFHEVSKDIVWAINHLVQASRPRRLHFTLYYQYRGETDRPLALDEPGVAARVSAVGMFRARLAALVALGDNIPSNRVPHALVEHVVDTLGGVGQEGGGWGTVGGWGALGGAGKGVGGRGVGGGWARGWKGEA